MIKATISESIAKMIILTMLKHHENNESNHFGGKATLSESITKMIILTIIDKPRK
jgi:hypothetical protein